MKLTKQNVPFTQVANVVLYDATLSLKAKGLYAYLFSKPDGWQFSALRMAGESSDGKRGIDSALQELEEHGYLVRHRESTGQMRYELVFSEPTPRSHPSPNSEPKCSNSTQPQVLKRLSGEKALVSNKDLLITSTSLSPNGQEEHMQRMLAHAKSRPSSEQQVIEFCKSVGLPQTDAEYFWNHWVANGFKNNKAAMKDWQAVIRSWKLAGHCPSQKVRRFAPNAPYSKPKEKAPVGAAYRPLYAAEDAEALRDKKWVEEQNKKHETHERDNDRRPT